HEFVTFIAKGSPRRDTGKDAGLGDAAGGPVGSGVQSLARRFVVLRVLRKCRTGGASVTPAPALRRRCHYPLLRYHDAGGGHGPAVRPAAESGASARPPRAVVGRC